jgi:hypothetical protein
VNKCPQHRKRKYYKAETANRPLSDDTEEDQDGVVERWLRWKKGKRWRCEKGEEEGDFPSERRGRFQQGGSTEKPGDEKRGETCTWMELTTSHESTRWSTGEKNEKEIKKEKEGGKKGKKGEREILGSGLSY